MIKRTHLTIFSLLLLLVLALTTVGCGVPQEEHDVLKAQLASVQKEYDATKNSLSSTQSQLSSMQSQLSSIQSQLSSMQSQLSSAQNETKKLQSDLTNQSTVLAQTQASNAALQKQVSELQNKLNGILDTSVIQYYEFSSQSIYYNWTLPIPLRTYFYYKEQPRPPALSRYKPMAIDSYADSVMNVLNRQLRDSALNNNLKQSDIVNLVRALTQTLPNSDKAISTPYDEYPRYPLETLFEQGGDSEDTSILAAAILAREGYDVVVFVFEQQKHVAIGVNVPGFIGYSLEYQGRAYLYLETIGKGGVLGVVPYYLRDIRPIIYPISR